MLRKPHRQARLIDGGANIYVEIVHKTGKYDESDYETTDHIFIICILPKTSDSKAFNS